MSSRSLSSSLHRSCWSNFRSFPTGGCVKTGVEEDICCWAVLNTLEWLFHNEEYVTSFIAEGSLLCIWHR